MLEIPFPVDSVKRQRTDTGSAPAISGPNYLEAIRFLPADKVSSILALAAQLHPDVATIIANERSMIIAAEHVKEVDYDHYLNVVRDVLRHGRGSWLDFDPFTGMARKALSNAEGKDSLSSRPYEQSFGIFSEVQNCINAIGKETPAHASCSAKISAFKTLYAIGKCILQGTHCCHCKGETLIVWKQFQYNNCLETTMLRIVESMSVVGRSALVEEEFGDKLMQLQNQGADHCLFEKLKKVQQALLNSTAQGFSDEEDEGDEDYVVQSEDDEESEENEDDEESEENEDDEESEDEEGE